MYTRVDLFLLCSYKFNKSKHNINCKMECSQYEEKLYNKITICVTWINKILVSYCTGGFGDDKCN